jgi:hypothetical protein
LGGDVRRVVGQMDNHARFQPVCVAAHNGFVGCRNCFEAAAATTQTESEKWAVHARFNIPEAKSSAMCSTHSRSGLQTLCQIVAKLLPSALMSNPH